MRALLIGDPAHLTEMDVADDQRRVLQIPQLIGPAVDTSRDPIPAVAGRVRVHDYVEHPPIYHPRTGAKVRRVFVWDER